MPDVKKCGTTWRFSPIAASAKPTPWQAAGQGPLPFFPEVVDA
jgi:hypothetical protein